MMAPRMVIYMVSALTIINFSSVNAQSTQTSSSSETACSSLINSLGTVKVKTGGLQYLASAKGAWNVFNQLDSEYVQLQFNL